MKKPFCAKSIFLTAALFYLFGAVNDLLSDKAHAGTPVYSCRIVKAYPHDPAAFTQGLLYYNGYLYESTGLYGRSSVRKVELETGEIRKKRTIPKQYFGEGIARRGNQLVILTWESRKGFIYDLETFRLSGQFPYETEGWGLTFDGTFFVMSDGSSTLRFLKPGTFKTTKTLEVRDGEEPISLLNELECVKGEIWANVLGSRRIARISPNTGKITGWIDLGSLFLPFDVEKTDVLNGIAYDPEKDRIFVTGKFWPKLFEIKVNQ
jgi:glutamine cyclotransferase